MQIPTREQCMENTKKAQLIEEKVNELFGKDTAESYIEACEFLDREETFEIAKHNQRIYILTIISIILRAEVESKVENNICRRRSVDKIVELYKVIVILLRRIEFDLPEELYEDLLNVMKAENISRLAVVGIINGSYILVQKRKLLQGFVDLLAQERRG